MRLARHASLAGALIAVLVAALFAAVLFAVGDVRATGDVARHHEETVAAVDRAERHLTELHSGLSGYALTHRPEFLDHWRDGRRTLGGDLQQVRRLTASDKAESDLVGRLLNRAGGFLAVYGNPAILKLIPRAGPVSQVGGALLARQQVNAIADDFAALRAHERRRADERTAARERAGHRAIVLGVAGLTGSMVLIAALVAYLLLRVVAPVRRLDHTARVDVTGHSEVRAIGEAFNTMATEIERNAERLHHLADHDPLTGLLNRRSFERALEQHSAQVARYGAEGAVLVLDVDDFKAINDTLGHRAGDELLVTVAETVRSRLRGSDVVARLGGDELAALLPRATAQEAAVAAQEIVDGVRTEVEPPSGPPRRITASVGVAAFSEVLVGEDVVVAADLAMYAAKAAGRDRVAVHGHDDSPVAV